MRVLIFGGSGKISRAVVSLFLKNNHEVWTINRGYRKNVLGVNTIFCNIFDYETINKELKKLKFDVVIDFLSYNLEDIVKKTALFNYDIDKYVFISSATVYDTSECYIVNEKSKIGNRFSSYAQSKIECEKYLISKRKKEKFPCIIVRPSQTYDDNSVPLGIHGEKGSWQVLQRMLEEKQVIIHGDGNTLWTMTRSCDFAQWLYDIVKSNKTVGEIFQITSSESLSWNDIYGIIADELGKELKAIYISSYSLSDLGKKFHLKETLLGDKARNIKFDNKKLHGVSDYIEKYNMEYGIRNSVQSVLNNQELQNMDVEFDKWNDKIIELYKKIMMSQ